MRIFQTPGVYFERADANGGGIAALRTDIAGFVGMAERGPLHLAVPVESFRQFQTWFGNVIDNGYLAYCARAFFENGGRRLWVVRVASEAAAVAAVTFADAASRPAWRVEASSAGVWGNDLSIRMLETRRTQVRAKFEMDDPRRLRLESIAGFSPQTLIEATQDGALVQRAIVESVDANTSRVTLDRELVGLGLGTSLRVETITYSIEVYELDRLLTLFENLSLVPEHPRYGPAVLKQPWQIIDRRHPENDPPATSSDIASQHFRIARARVAEAAPRIVIRELRDAGARYNLDLLVLPAPTERPSLRGGADGLAALTEHDFIGAETTPLDSDIVQAAARRGLRALEAVDEVSVLAVPDIHIQPRPPVRMTPPPSCTPDACLPLPPVLPMPVRERSVGDVPPRFDAETIYRVQAAMILQCEKRRDRVALLDAPFDTCNKLTFAATELRAWRRRFDSKFAALYAPWLDVVDPVRAAANSASRSSSLTRPIPPSGHIAGVIAAMDFKRGVHAAPANASLTWVQNVSLDLDDERHGLLNDLGINVIRAQPGRGVRPLGARTVSSDTDWRFLNVRRLMSMIGKALDISIQWAVFEPNDWRTRAKLALVIGSFLQELWARGALVGDTPDQGYFVRCDDTNNPPDARARGELLIEIGVAPSVPFEFIVLRIGRDANAFAIAEDDPRQAAA